MSMLTLMSERGLVNVDEVYARLGSAPAEENVDVVYKEGDIVKVKDEHYATRIRRPHLRTPGYIFGKIGTIVRINGSFDNPELAAYREKGPKQPLYTVAFSQKDVWEAYEGAEDDSVQVDINQTWLEPSTQEALETQKRESHKHKHHHHHGKEVDHGDHTHEARFAIEQKAVDLEGDDSEKKKLSEALIQELLAKGVITAEELRQSIEVVDSWDQDPRGPKIVARAWVDPHFKEKLLEDANAALSENSSTKLVVVENTDSVHNLVVCTLCSCYPVAILGLSPPWYKSRSYRAKAVKDPRGTLKDFGTILSPHVKMKVHDATADLRFMVLPKRPEGTQGWSESDLAKLVTRDSLIGVSFPKTP